MMVRLLIALSLLLALLALQGWPLLSSAWVHALLALAFLVLGVSSLARLGPARGDRPYLSARRPGGLDHALAGLALLALAGLAYLLLVFLPPSATRLSLSLHTLLRGGPPPTQSGEPGLRADATAGPHQDFQISTWFEPEGARVPESARLRPSEHPQVSIQTRGHADTQRLRDLGRIYVHAFAYNAFDGERWTSVSPDGPRLLRRDEAGLIRLADGDGASAFRHTVYHHQQDAGRNTLCALQGMREARLGTLTRLNSGTWLLPPSSGGSPYAYRYEVVSSPRTFRDLVASGATSIEPGQADPVHLAPAIHTGVNQHIQRLSPRFTGPEPLRARLLDLQDWLQRSFAYSTALHYPEQGKPALESFLEEPGAKPGFCVHFASAAALLLREMGVPSRVTYGWTGGEFYPAHDRMVFRGEHAHAWTEIHLKDHGWVVFETTPAIALPESRAAAAGAAPPVPESDAQKRDRTTRGPAWSAWLGAGVALGLAGIVLGLMARMRRQTPGGQGREIWQEAPAEAPAYLKLFHRSCVAMGNPKPEGSTLRAFLAQLERKGLHLPYAGELLRYHYRVAYREGARDPAFEKKLCRWIRDRG